MQIIGYDHTVIKSERNRSIRKKKFLQTYEMRNAFYKHKFLILVDELQLGF